MGRLERRGRQVEAVLREALRTKKPLALKDVYPTQRRGSISRRVAAIDIDGQVGFATDEDSDSDGWMEGLEDVFGINNSKEKLDEGRHRQDKNGGQYRNGCGDSEEDTEFEDSDHDTDENKDEENCESESESESGGEDNS